jgi:gliding motility-associated-like protein
MTKVFFLVALSFSISVGLNGQCPTITLSSTSGTTCGLTTLTIANNTFGGNASRVTLKDDGAGSVSPGSSNTSPFDFTYTPKAGDLGKTVTITITTDNPVGPCPAATATYTLMVTIGPSLTLSSSSGNTCSTTPVTINNNTFSGGATNVTLTHDGTGILNPASSGNSPFSFTYTPASGDIGNQVTITITTDNPLGSHCIAAIASYVLTVNANPSAPLPGIITQPSCALTTGSVQLGGLPPFGSWTITRSPGGTTHTGSGVNTIITGIPSGTYTFTVTNSSGCVSLSSTNVVINPQLPVPAAPVIGTIIQPGCIVLTGIVTLTGLPSSGSWTITRSPGDVTTTGSGASTTISNLNVGTYTFKVTNSSGCISPSSGNVVISSQSVIPLAPVIGTISAPTCTLPTGSVLLSGLPSSGSWTLTRYPGNVVTTGTGISTTVSGIPAGVFNYTVANSSGCVSAMSANVNIPLPPNAPTPPLIGTIIQPTQVLSTGSVNLTGLPGTGTLTLILQPGNSMTSGSGTTTIISGLVTGIYSFTVTNASGCISGQSASFEINAVITSPIVKITNPLPVCFPSTVDLTSPTITAGSTHDLIYTYWSDSTATRPFNTPGAASSGIYYIKGTTSSGLFSIKQVKVTVYKVPKANAGPDQTLPEVFNTTLNAVLSFSYETGIWSLISGSGIFADSTFSRTTVTGLSHGKNIFAWKVTNHICPPSADTVIINVRNVTFPTLITPNNDGINDYLILKKPDSSVRMDLVIFDRRGAEVYRNRNYDNSWNGVDYNEKPLPDDTYFYILKSDDGTSDKGFIVIRRLK